MFANYAPLLSVVPLWADRGGAASAGAGATTGAVMATTVAIQLVMPQLMSRFGARFMLAGGAVLLGLPTLGYLVSADLVWLLVVSAVRGFGFGIVAVAGAALVAELAPDGRRGQALGLYGVAVGLPMVLAQPLGVWVADTIGFAPVFVTTAALCLLGAPLVVAMSPGGARSRGALIRQRLTRPQNRLAFLSARAVGPRGASDRLTLDGIRLLLAPWLVMLSGACALGGVISFLPLALPSAGAASLSLFVLFLVALLARWGAGVWADRAGAGRLLTAGLVLAALGMAGLAVAVHVETAALPVALAASALYGSGWGAIQSEALVIMFRQAGAGRIGTASAVWNMAFDAGTGIGAVVVGLLAGLLGMPGAFAVMAAAMALVLPVAWREPRRLRTA